MITCCFKQNTAVSPSQSTIDDTDLAFFDINQYNPMLLGDGASSYVYRIEINKVFYTCKKIKPISHSDEILREAAKARQEKKIQKEITILKNVNDVRLPYFYKYIKSDTYYILYDFIEGKDLFKIIIENRYNVISNYKLISQITYEITLGLQALFKSNYVHLDIKPENIILLSINPVRLKIIDLAYCMKINNKTCKTSAGTYGYASPEIMLHRKYYHNSDIWSLGIILYILITNQPLFDNENKDRYLEDLEYFTNIFEYTKIKNLPKNVGNLLNNMLKIRHTARFSIKDVLQSNFIKEFSK